MKLAIIALASLVGLTGCATGQLGSVANGGANYTYKKTKQGCEVMITSAREVEGGNLTINKDCSLTVATGSMSGAINAMNGAVSAINTLVGKVK